MAIRVSLRPVSTHVTHWHAGKREERTHLRIRRVRHHDGVVRDGSADECALLFSRHANELRGLKRGAKILESPSTCLSAKADMQETARTGHTPAQVIDLKALQCGFP